MAGTPRYPEDWATRFGTMKRAAKATTGSAQSRIPYTGGTLTGNLAVGGTAATGPLTATSLTTGAVDATGLTGTSLNISGDAAIGDDLAVTGDLIVGGVTVTAALLALILAPPTAVLEKGGTQSIPNEATTTVLTYTAPAAGYYSVTAAVPWANNATNRREASFLAGGAVFEGESKHSSSNTKLVNSLAALVPLNVGQAVDLRVWQNTGAGLNVLASTRLDAIWQRPL